MKPNPNFLKRGEFSEFVYQKDTGEKSSRRVLITDYPPLDRTYQGIDVTGVPLSQLGDLWGAWREYQEFLFENRLPTFDKWMEREKKVTGIKWRKFKAKGILEEEEPTFD